MEKALIQIKEVDEELSGVRLWLLIEERVVDFDRLLEKRETLFLQEIGLERIVKEVRQIEIDISIVRANITEKEDRYKKMLEEIGECPICGSKIGRSKK